MVSLIPLPVLLLVFIFYSVFGDSSPAASNITTLGVDETDSDHYDLRRSFRCPGVGNYTVRASGNCAKYYECKRARRRPVALKQCPDPDKNKFNRLSRTCEKSEFVKCKWCRKTGYHADRTSEKHFISCLPGRIASRFKCEKGTYDPVKRQCKKTKGATFDIKEDAEDDPPHNIVKFMKEWIENEEEEKSDSKKHKKGDDSDEDKKKSKSKKKKDSDEESGEDKKKKKKKKKDSDEDKDGKQKGRTMFGGMVNVFTQAAGAMMQVPPHQGLPIPPVIAPSGDSKLGHSIELSDSSEERKKNEPAPKKDDKDGSEEKDSDEKDKKKKKKKKKGSKEDDK